MELNGIVALACHTELCIDRSATAVSKMVAFKMALTKAKQVLVTKKNENGFDYAIKKMDIVGLV